MPNKLVKEASPYLLQHANNPVDWYPWGEEALEKARQENKPIFLSIGYAACHWCHVMEQESFEDPDTARLLNDHFVSIKVDREERPDLDGIYMNAVMTMTGQGGWPMSVFLTPQGEPFYGGTYFPPTRRYGMPSFQEVLNAVAKSWLNDSAELRRVAGELAQHLNAGSSWGTEAGGPPGSSLMRKDTLQQAAQTLLNTYDWNMGGWGKAPRFPQPMAIEFLLAQATRGVPKALDAAVHALAVMSRGGLYDVVGGGFHRYSVDDSWLVPHFEKMLYDNAQLALAYLHGYLLTGSLSFRQTTTETLDFILREMTHSAGGFFSSLDADSEGEEGKYYVWSNEEINSTLNSADRDLFNQIYLVSDNGNFEGKNILQRAGDTPTFAKQFGLSEESLLDRLNHLHKTLLATREKRVRPMTDDKVLVSWNALALRAFAEAARYLNRSDYLDAARKNASFLLNEMTRGGILYRAWREGQAKNAAFLEDYAGLILALLSLYQSDPDLRWYQSALHLTNEMNRHFRDEQGGFFDTRQDHGQLITRPKGIEDNATPSGNALAAGALLQLSAFDEQGEWRTQAEAMIGMMQDLMVRHPTAFGLWLQDLDFAIGPVQQIAVIGPEESAERQAMLDHIWQTYRPRVVTVVSSTAALEETPNGDHSIPGLLHDRGLLDNRPTAYVCEGFSCKLPVNELEGLKQQVP